ncbi:serine/threonine protein kinase [Gammaproteobacteria bacterium]|nr:serine/threonine protein kinase [Gammaproteobacteria bacterium]
MEELPPGTIIGNDYRVLGILGRGGFGITYKCEDIRLKLFAAVKEYFPEGLASRDAKSMDIRPNHNASETYDWGLKKFLLEGTTLAAIQHKYANDHIVKIIRYFEERKTAYLAMEFVDGMPIGQFANSDLITSAEQVEELFQSLCKKALKPIHDANFYHRDIKPENILVRSSNLQPVIIDFGAARQTAGGKSTVALLTPRYSAVEQYASQEDGEDDLDGDLCGPFTDIYSLAATFYFIIKGEPPQDAPSRILDDNSDSLFGDESLSHYKPSFLQQIDWGMEPIPKDRPQTVDDWLDVQKSEPDSKPNKVASFDVSKERLIDSFAFLSKENGPINTQKFVFIAAPILAVFLFIFALIPSNDETKVDNVPIVPVPESATAPERDAVDEGNESGSEIFEPSMEDTWIVGIDAVEWTPIDVLPKLRSLGDEPEGSFRIKLHADEPFRVKTERGLALTKAQAQRLGDINGEIFLKSVNGKPQPVRVEIVRSD